MSNSSSPAAGTLPGALVKYQGPTDNLGSSWRATVKRGADFTWRAAVPFAAGPDAAVEAVLAKVNRDMQADWGPIGRPLSLDGGNTYVYGIGPDYMA
jgi:hypothetical protein